MTGKILTLFFLFLFFLCPKSYADDSGNLLDINFDVDRVWDGQQSVTNQEFDNVVEKIEDNVKKKEEKKRKKRLKKLFGSGTTLHKELNPDNDVKEFDILKPNKDGVLVNIPVDLYFNNNILEKGFYKLEPVRDKKTKKIYINFYQSHSYKGKIEVNETQNDFGKEQIDFAEILPYNEDFVKLIFGSIDFNAYVYISIVKNLAI